MNEMSLSRLYRRLTAQRDQAVVTEADTADFVAVASGEAEALPPAQRAAVAATVASSPRHADLARLLRALRPESEALAGALADRRSAAHPMRHRDARPLHAARRNARHPLRWVGSIAACFAFALGVVIWHDRPTSHDWNNVTTSVATVQRSDRIFTSQDRIFAASDARGSRPHSGHRDELFRGDFSGG